MLVATQRLSTVELADRVVVVDDGRVIGSLSFAEIRAALVANER